MRRHSGKEHLAVCVFDLHVHDEKLGNFAALIGNYTSTNRTFSIMVGPYFVGCHSHRFNLAVKDILDGKKDQIDKIQVIVKKLSYSISSAL